MRQFSFVQSFVVNLESKMVLVDNHHGILVDQNYKSVRDFIERNYSTFTKDIQLGLENIIDFYDKNKDIIEIGGKKLDFVTCICLTEINEELRQFFMNIIFNKL